MANRFIRLIEEGTLASETELRSAFRAYARATHPDLEASGSSAEGSARSEAFIKARAEYEAAVRYLAPKARNEAGRGTIGRFDRDLFYAELSALLKAGFPKCPRHDKERSKYARLRVRVRSELAAYEGAASPVPLPAFDAFEAELLALKEDETRQADVSDYYALLDALVEYRECGLVPLRAAIEIEFAAIRAKAPSVALVGFLAFLVGDMEGGPALG